MESVPYLIAVIAVMTAATFLTRVLPFVLLYKVADHPVLADKDAEILLYCKNGGRSTLAAHTLKRMGFSNVKMLVGGYDGWEGHTVETDPSVYK